MNDEDKKVKSYPIVGRNSHIDLSKYTVRVIGRDVIDYEKIKVNEPELYRQILANERAENRLSDLEKDEIFSDQ
jgi:hypothetical protein